MHLRASLADRPPYRKFLIIVGLVMVSSVIFTSIGSGLVKTLFGVDLALWTGESNAGPQTVQALRLFQALAAVGTFLVPAWAAAFLFSERAAEYTGLSGKPGGMRGAVILFILFLAGIPFINWMALVNSQLHLPGFLAQLEEWMVATEQQAARLTELLLGGTSTTDLFWNMLVIAVLPALGEELLFRGIIQRQFVELAGNKHVGVVLTAFLFSALHMQFFGFFPRFVLGLVLGYLFHWSGNLWMPILAHFFNNALTVFLTWISARGVFKINPDVVGIAEGQEALLAASVFLSFAGLWMFRRLYPAESGVE